MKKYREHWVIRNRPGDVTELVKRLGITPQFARLLWNRGYDTEEKIAAYLYSVGTVASGEHLPDAEAFYRILIEKRTRNAKVRVIGDYDVDGVTATYLMLSGLHELGIEADYRIPDRVLDGYGISLGMVGECIRDGVDTIVTVDNGIAAMEAISFAKSEGITVLVTDHHEPQNELPEADVIVNPKRKDAEYYADNLCGAVVAGKLMDYVLQREGQAGFLERHVEIMALATVCDVMDLSGESRTIVKQGLSKKNTRWNYGLRTLKEVCGLTREVRVYDLGFVIGPSINALGRIETADGAVELLLSQDQENASFLSRRMVAVNSLRKEQTVRGVEQARAYVDSLGEYIGDILVIPLSDCHESLAGIIAGRIREEYYRPTIVLTKSELTPGMWKGSARSTENYSIFNGLQACAELLVRFGGHDMAAGLSLMEENVDALRGALQEHFRSIGATGTKKVSIDLVLTFEHLTPVFVEEMSRMEPYGKGNPKPVLATRNVTLCSLQYIGKEAKFLKLQCMDETGRTMTGLYFKGTEAFIEDCTTQWGEAACKEAFRGLGNKQMNLLYSADINEYRGMKEVQLVIEEVQFLK